MHQEICLLSSKALIGLESENGMEMQLPVIPLYTKLCIANVPNKRQLKQTGMAESCRAKCISVNRCLSHLRLLMYIKINCFKIIYEQKNRLNISVKWFKGNNLTRKKFLLST